MKSEDRLLTPPEVCAYLRIKRSQLYRLTCERRIPFIKLGNLLRFRKADLDKWVTEQANHIEH